MTLIGKGAQADVFLREGKAVKLFRPGYGMAACLYEALMQSMARESGLPVPAVHEVTEIDGQNAIVMEYAEGKTLGALMLEDMRRMEDCLRTAIEWQCRVHAVSAGSFPKQKDKLRKNIGGPGLETEEKERLLRLLDSLEGGELLCHGDFHVMNLLQTPDGIRIIDWVDASCGSARADICRSYMLYLLSRPEVAEAYLRLYCAETGTPGRDILRWLPVVAGARLASERPGGEDVRVLNQLIRGLSPYC